MSVKPANPLDLIFRKLEINRVPEKPGVANVRPSDGWAFANEAR